MTKTDQHHTARLDPDELRKKRVEFFLNGQTVADWAREHKFQQSLVYAVLCGRVKGTRGESHKIAVKLGLKTRQQGAHLIGPENARQTPEPPLAPNTNAKGNKVQS